jgi:hypothetical protein
MTRKRTEQGGTRKRWMARSGIDIRRQDRCRLRGLGFRLHMGLRLDIPSGGSESWKRLRTCGISQRRELTEAGRHDSMSKEG